MNFINKQVLLFDLDGTLVDSVPDLAIAVNHTLTELGLNNFSQTQIRGWVGNGALALIQRALSGGTEISKSLDVELTEKALKIFFTAYTENVCRETTAYDGVLETLQSLKGLGYRLAIITNKPARFVEPILTDLGLQDLFELILGGDSLKYKKPHPLPLTYACEQLGVTIENSIMIGDSKNDILAAKEAGMHSIGLTYGYNYGEHIAEYQPELVLAHFSDLLPVFKV